MNIVKTSSISARTKSLRDKFSSKRSMSELSFGQPSTSTSSLAASDSSRPGSFRRIKSTRAQPQAISGRPLPPSVMRAREPEVAVFNQYLPEDAFNSALDINCQLLDGEPRFPWQRDVAIQCDLLSDVVPQILVNSPSPIPGRSASPLRNFGHRMFGDKHTSFQAHPAAAHLLYSGEPGSLSGGASTTNIPTSPSSVGLAALMEQQHPPSAPGTPVCPITPTPTKKYSHFAGLRFWKSSSPLNPMDPNMGQQVPPRGSPTPGKRHKTSFGGTGPSRKSGAKSVLQRAVSFDSRGYCKLISNDSVSSLAEAAKGHPSSVADEDSSGNSVFGFPADLMSPSKSEMTIITTNPFHHPRTPPAPMSSPNPPSTTDHYGLPLRGATSGHSVSQNVLDRRSIFMNRRQPSSAPDSFDDDDLSASSPETPTSDAVRSNHRHGLRHKNRNRNCPQELIGGNQQHIFTFDTMQKLFDLKLRTKASESTAAAVSATSGQSDPNKDPSEIVASVAASVAAGTSGPGSYSAKPNLLDIPSGTSGPRGGGYLSLPSPNVHGQESASTVFKKLSSQKMDGDESEVEDQGPEVSSKDLPASALHRRQALVPPKLITDDYDCSDMDTGQSPSNRASPNLLAEPRLDRSRRRSSTVIIPPMQICPGDLLVYSKVLHNQNNLFDNLDVSTSSFATEEGNRNKNKNTWSLLKLFDRSNRGKSDSICGLEEVLSQMTPSVFVDEQLSKYKGLAWCDFLSQFEDRRSSSFVSGHRLSQPTSEVVEDSRRSSSSTTQSTEKANPVAIPTILSRVDSKKLVLKRHETFDSPAPTHQDDQLLAVAHSTRSHSCIAPVDMSIRRLSGGVNLIEESSIDLLEESKGSSLLPESPSLFDPLKSPSKEELLSPVTSRPPLPPGNPPPSPPSPSSAIRSAAVAAAVASASSIVSSARSSFAVTRTEQKRREALWDLFQSECNFLYDHLMVLKNVFMEPLKKIQVEGFAMYAEPEVLFGNLDELCCVTYAFCKEFLSVILSQMNSYEVNATDALVKLFQKSSKAASLTQAYHRYTLNYINALTYLETLRRQAEFNEFEKWCSRDPRCKKLQLTDLLVSPVQHVMRVPLILKDIESRTEDGTEKEVITAIIDSEEMSLRELDDKMKWLKNFERLLEIQRNIQWPPMSELDPKVYIPDFLKGPLAKQPCERLIVSPRRQIILEGPLNLLDSGKSVEMYLILFDDMFIITRRKKGLTKKQSSLTEKWASSCGKSSSSATLPSGHDSLFKYVVYKQPLSLDRFYIHDVTPQEAAANNLKYSFVLVCLNRFQQIITCHTLQAPNEASKLMWLTRLRDTTDRWKRTLQNSVFRSQPRLSTASTISSGSTAVQTRSSSIATTTNKTFASNNSNNDNNNIISPSSHAKIR